MANIDDRVVSMSWDNQKFQQGVQQTIDGLTKLNASLKNVGVNNGLDQIEKSANKINFLGLGTAIDKLKAKLGFGKEAQDGLGQIETASSKVTLEGANTAVDKLKGKLNFPEAANGFSEIDKAAAHVDFRPLSSAIDSVESKFSELTIIGTGALTALSMDATRRARSIVNSFSLGPISQGFQEYATNLNSIQTILANTEASGAGLKDVNHALSELNHYSDKTIYNFSEMARNIGTFTAAGVGLKPATSAIKGIANLAALSGSNSQQASTAMYQLSQAIAAGRVSLQDWNSVVNAGMGGSVFQRALARTAEQMGTLSKGSVELKGKMKNVSIEGKSFRESIMAKPGEQSWLTSKVLTKTLSQFTGDLSNAQLKAQGFNDAQIKAIQQTAKTAQHAATEVKTINQVFDVAKETLGSGWSKTFQTIFGNFKESKSTFTELSNTINGFINANANARNKVLGDWKKLGGRTDLIEGIKNVFKALGSVIKPIKEAFRDIFPATTGKDLADLTKRFREFTESLKIGPETAENLKRSFKGVFAVFDIGKQVLGGIVSIFKRIFGAASEGSGGFLHFTGNIGDALVALDEWLKKGDRLKDFFDKLGAAIAKPVKLLKQIGEALAGASDGIDHSTSIWSGFLHIIDGVADRLAPALKGIVDLFGNVGNEIADALAGADLDKVFDVLQVGLIGGLIVAVKKGLGGGLVNFNFGDITKGLSTSLNTLNTSLQSIQRSLSAATLLAIAAAVALLAGAAVALSKIDPKKLGAALTAMAISMGQLLAAMALMSKIGGGLGVASTAASMVLLATSLNIMALAVKQFATMDWPELAKGLVGVGGALVAVGAAMPLISANSAGFARVSVSLIALGIALNEIALAVKIFATMKWEDMARGLVGVTGALVGIGLAMNLMPLNMPITAAGLILVGIALNEIALAVKVFSTMSWEALGKGLAATAVSLVAIGAAMTLFPPTLPLTAAGLILVGIALNGVAAAIALLGHMKISTLVKGIAAIAGVLVVLAAGLTAMVASLPGAAALLVAAGALAILAPVIALFGNMKWGTIIKGIIAITAAIAIIGTAATLAAPGLIAMGIALGILGLGVLAVGAGVKLLASGLSILGSDGAKGVAVMIAALTGMVAILPKVVVDFIKGLVEILAAIAELAPKVVASMVKIANALLDVVIKSAPKMAAAATALITAILTVIADNFEPILQAGIKILEQLLKGISDNIGKVTNQVIDIVLHFLSAITGRLPSLIKSGAKALAAFLSGIADHIADVVKKGADVVVKFLSGIADKIPDVIAAGTKIIVKIIQGIGQSLDDIIAAGVKAAAKFIEGVANSAVKLARAGAQAVIDFLNGLAAAIRDKGPEIVAAGANLAEAFIEAVIKGLASLPGRIKNKLGDILPDLNPTHLFNSFTPEISDVKIDATAITDWSNSVLNAGNQTAATVEDTQTRAINTMTNSVRRLSSFMNDISEIDPTITPVLDLSQVQKDAAKLTDLTAVTPIEVTASANQAALISLSQESTPEVTAQSVTEVLKEIKFEQNNYSPEALSEIEIYRLTHNQLAQAKDALGI